MLLSHQPIERCIMWKQTKKKNNADENEMLLGPSVTAVIIDKKTIWKKIFICAKNGVALHIPIDLCHP